MNWQESYADICSQLRIVQIHEMEVRRRVEQAHTVMLTGEMPSSGSYCHLPLDKAITHYNNAVEALDEVQCEVDRLSCIKREMEEAMNGFNSRARLIQRKRLVEGKTYKEIAGEMNLSEQSLRNIVHRQRNKMSTQSTNAS